MARLSYDSSSEDDFPSLRVVATRMKQQQQLEAAKSRGSTADKENTQPKEASSRVRRQEKLGPTASLSKGTPLRRRKLGDLQPLDNPLFRKWSEDATESRGRRSRTCSRELKGKTPEVSESSLQEMSTGLEESDDDVFVRRRRPARPAAPKTRRERAESLVKTDALVSVVELNDEVNTVEETLEISAIISAGEEESSSDEESEFVTALSEGVESESEYESPSELDFAPKPRRQRSPSAQRLTNVMLAPPGEPGQKEVHVKKQPAKQNQPADSSEKEPIANDVHRTFKVRPRKAAATAGSLEDDFEKLQLYTNESDDLPIAKPQPQLEPVTPRKTLQAIPLKMPKIPPSPWKAEHKEFWDVEVQNEWIDRHSPPKRSPKKLDLTGGADKETLKKKYGTSPEKRDAKKAFEQTKEKLAQDFLLELDERITSSQLSKLTTASGGLQIKWSASLQTTAGRAHWKCKEVTTMVQQPDGSLKSTKERRHEAWIELASKVLTNEDNLLNTVAHEFCHLAVFMLNGKPKFAHGAEFKSWGQKCMDAFQNRGIEVTTKHNYEIDFKFIWRCVDCISEVKRHSKSVDPVKQKCGRCRGTLEQVKPVPRAGAKGRSAYQEFVSQEMKAIKAEGKALSFKDMMAIVSTRWKAQQQASKSNSTGAADKDLKGLEEELEELVVTDLVSD